MQPKQLVFLLILLPSLCFAQLTPEVTSWIINDNGATGYAGIPSNVQLVQYSPNWVYVTCTCIPGYDIGPWPGNPNTPANQNFCFRITRSPLQNTGNLVNTPMGHIGTWSNGVSIFNAKDGMSYNNQNIWYQNAILAEGASFDTCLGHPAPNGEYHHHLFPNCLFDETDSLSHSPVIGYAFDGFPIYGSYGFVNPNGTGGIARMRSSYQERNITTRTTLPDGTVLNPSQYGPQVSSFYPLGYYLQDFEYTGTGDLDEHNGRFCVTPDYPLGIYAYFVTIDEQLQGEYPYTLGPTYYGTVPTGNTGPHSGHNEPDTTEVIIIYTPSSGIAAVSSTDIFSVYPNPSSDAITIMLPESFRGKLELLNVDGKQVYAQSFPEAGTETLLDVTNFSAGIYLLRITDGRFSKTARVCIR